MLATGRAAAKFVAVFSSAPDTAPTRNTLAESAFTALLYLTITPETIQ
jgi:hypothetical protein